MEEEKSILDATEYLLVALNNIKSYDDFNDYKEEMEKAIYDIRNSITNIIDLKNNKKLNLNNADTSNKTNKTSISTMLGLKFNYDAYLKDFNINNLNQRDFNIDNYNNNLIKNNIEKENNNNINEEYNEQNNTNKQNNIGLISFKDENTNFENNINNDDNVIYNKSIRNKFKKSKYNKNIDNINNDKIKDFNNKNINIKKNEKPIELNKNISNNTNTNTNTTKKKESSLGFRKEKLSLIADIIMKINSEDYYYEILTKLFGSDLTDKLMSSDVSDELLEAVQNSIKEIDELKNKDNLNQEQNNKNDNINQEELEEEPRKFPSNEIMGPNIKNKNITKINKERYSDKYQEFDFQKNLRKNENSEGKKTKGKNSNNNVKKEKPFISATSVYGNYFDPSLQKGGISKLDNYKK